MKKEAPSIDQWLKEAKADPAAKNCGMFLVHNGTVRQTAKALVRQGAADTLPVKGMDFSYDVEKLSAAIDRAQTLAAREDWPAAGAAVAEARQEWECSRTFVSALADHQPLEDIECLFAMLEAYAREQDETEFQAACADLSRRILAVKEAQEFNLGSIF